MDEIALLRLLQLADSALPVGSASHSYGLESLVDDGVLDAGDLETFFRDYLQETGALEAVFCRAAHRLSNLSGDLFATEWAILNERLSARRLARESRDASLALGRRFLRLASGLLPEMEAFPGESHHATAFGLVMAKAGVGERAAVMAWLHQSMATLIYAAQRLAPLGQTRASSILWTLKPLIAEIARESTDAEPDCFSPGPEIASMRHTQLTTRLFIS